jgi:hypothetical protein
MIPRLLNIIVAVYLIVEEIPASVGSSGICRFIAVYLIVVGIAGLWPHVLL